MDQSRILFVGLDVHKDSIESVTMRSAKPHQLTRKGKSVTILTVGIDLTKNAFALDDVNEAGKPELLRLSVPRAKLNTRVAGLPP